MNWLSFTSNLYDIACAFAHKDCDCVIVLMYTELDRVALSNSIQYLIDNTQEDQLCGVNYLVSVLNFVFHT